MCEENEGILLRHLGHFDTQRMIAVLAALERYRIAASLSRSLAKC